VNRSVTTRALAVGIIGATVLTVAAGPVANATAAHRSARAAVGLPPIGSVWVSNLGEGGGSDGYLLEFAPSAHGNAAPVATVAGNATGLIEPAGIATDNDGRVWVADDGIPYSIKEFSSHAKGDVAPLATISGSKTLLDVPIGLVVRQNGDIWVANFGNSSVAEFAPGAHGNATPLRVITGTKTKLANLAGIAVSPDGKRVWATEHNRANSSDPAPVVYEYSGTAKGNVAPIASLTGTNTRLDAAYGVTVGISGNNPIVSDANAGGTMGVLAFGPGVHGNIAPRRVISGVTSGVTIPGLIAIDAVGDVWVPNYFSNVPGFLTTESVARFSPSQNGNVAPATLITGSATNLVHPTGVAVFNTPPLEPLSLKGKGTKKSLRLTWKAPNGTGGGLLGYVVRDRTKHGAWKALKTTTSRSDVLKRPHAKRYYDVLAFNDIGDSSGTAAIKPKV
jgi:hypothetical protein